MDGRGWHAVEKLNPMPTGQLKCSRGYGYHNTVRMLKRALLLTHSPRFAKTRLSPTEAALPCLEGNNRRFTIYVSRM